MARHYDGALGDTKLAAGASRRVDHSTARAFAAALSALAISSLVVTTSSNALNRSGTIAADHFDAGTVAIGDQASGASLIELTNMAPGRPEQQCINVGYEGSIVPVRLTLAAAAGGSLGPHVHVDLEEGTGAEFGNCDGFVASGQVFSGSLSRLAEDSPLPLGRLLNHGDSVGFRFRFEPNDDDDSVGLPISISLVWEVSPG